MDKDQNLTWIIQAENSKAQLLTNWVGDGGFRFGEHFVVGILELRSMRSLSMRLRRVLQNRLSEDGLNRGESMKKLVDSCKYIKEPHEKICTSKLLEKEK